RSARGRFGDAVGSPPGALTRGGAAVGITPPAYVSAGRPVPRRRGMPPGIPLPVARVLLDRGLELGACGDLHALARRHLDLGTRLRVAARARSRGDLLESDP